MKYFEYGDQEVGFKEMVFTVSSMIIGVGVLTLPRSIAGTVKYADGWMSIVIAGVLSIAAAWAMGLLTTRFQGKTYHEYVASMTIKPLAYAITFVYCIFYILFTAFEVRSIASVAKLYLFKRTPVEYVALVFLLVVVYAVFGKKAGLIRLSVLFLPLVLAVAIAIMAFTVELFEVGNIKPMFVSDFQEITNGAKHTIYSLLGFDIILFYALLMNKPKDAPKAAVIGTALPVLFYLFIYMISIGVFSFQGTREIMFPTIELAKGVEVPGEFFERFESLFFVVWIMTIFNTTSMALDITVTMAGWIWKKVKKEIWLYTLAPIIYAISMIPQNTSDFFNYADILSIFGLVISVAIPVAILFLSFIRRGKTNAS